MLKSLVSLPLSVARCAMAVMSSKNIWHADELNAFPIRTMPLLAELLNRRTQQRQARKLCILVNDIKPFYSAD